MGEGIRSFFLKAGNQNIQRTPINNEEKHTTQQKKKCHQVHHR